MIKIVTIYINKNRPPVFY